MKNTPATNDGTPKVKLGLGDRIAKFQADRNARQHAGAAAAAERQAAEATAAAEAAAFRATVKAGQAVVSTERAAEWGQRAAIVPVLAAEHQAAQAALAQENAAAVAQAAAGVAAANREARDAAAALAHQVKLAQEAVVDLKSEHRTALTTSAVTARVGKNVLKVVAGNGDTALKATAAQQAATRRAIATGKAPLPAPRIAAPTEGGVS